MPLEEVQKNTGTPVSTEVSSQQTNPVEQPDTTVDTKAVQQTATATQPAAQNAQQPTVETSSVEETATDLWTWEKVEIRDYNDISYTDTVLDDMINNRYVWWTWIAVDAAKERYRNYRAYGWLTYKQLWDTIMSWWLYANWTTMNDIHKYNPELWTQTQNYIMNQSDVANLNEQMYNTYSNMNGVETNKNYVKNTVTTSTSDGKSETTSSITEFSDELMNYLQSYWIQSGALVDLMKEKLQSSDIQLAKNKILVQEEKIRTIQKQIDEVWEDARKMLWSSAPESLVSAYISQQTKLLQRQLNTENNSLLTLQGKLDNLLDDAKMELDYTVKEMQMNQDLAKSILWLKWSSSSSLSSTSKTWEVTDTSIKALKDDMLNWKFWWDFSDSVMKVYWLDKSSQEAVLKSVAEWLESFDELETLKSQAPEDTYKKLLQYFVNSRWEDVKKVLSDNISNTKLLADWVNTYWFTEKQIKSILDWIEDIDVTYRNALYRTLWWNVDNEETTRDVWLPFLKWKKSSTETIQRWKEEASAWRMPSEFLDKDWKAVNLNTALKKIWGELNSATEYNRVLENLYRYYWEPEHYTEDANWNEKETNEWKAYVKSQNELYNWYIDNNWAWWKDNLKWLREQWYDADKIQVFLSATIPWDTSLQQQLLKDAWFLNWEIETIITPRNYWKEKTNAYISEITNI